MERWPKYKVKTPHYQLYNPTESIYVGVYVKEIFCIHIQKTETEIVLEENINWLYLFTFLYDANVFKYEILPLNKKVYKSECKEMDSMCFQFSENGLI